MNKIGKVREMRDAETVLGIIRARGERGLPLDDVYRQLYNPTLYLRAYGRIYRNNGAMTKGSTEETVDGMSLAKIEALIEALRFERYQWTPVRRTHIPKKYGKTRPLGIPTWSDKLLQEVLRSILEAYYEPQFSDNSHGFRPARGCHTALTEVYRVWHGTKWFIEGDIRGCFDNIQHDTLMAGLRERIHDNRVLRLIENLLKAGYMEYGWKYDTLSGTPQGGIISPILSNIYLDRLDKFVEQHLIPEYTCGERRKNHAEYAQTNRALEKARKRGDREQAEALTKHRRTLPSVDPEDPDYRRLRYIRYADDFLLGFAGPKAEAEDIKTRLKEFLGEELKLELSEEKTLVTHAGTEAARFLGYELHDLQCNTKMTGTIRSINGGIGLRIPAEFVKEKSQLYMANGKPVHRKELTEDDDFTIVSRYQMEYRGYVQYYLLAQNVHKLNHLRYIMETSLLKTLANKHKTSVSKILQKYRAKTDTPHGKRTCLQVVVEREGKKPLVATFGGVPLRRNIRVTLTDKTPHSPISRNELLKRLLADECEACGSNEAVEVHHIRKLADLRIHGRGEMPLWVRVMHARRRKTLVLCRVCHDNLHAGRPLRYRDKE